MMRVLILAGRLIPREVSTHKANPPEPAASRWPHRMACVLVCAAFLQILLGGAVTSYKAGTAVPDWPTTYDHWLYPPRLWPAAPRDLLLVCSHRTLGAAVIALAVALAVVLWTLDRRKWMRPLAVAAVAGVLLQEVLGGLRVRGDEILLARMHACTAPLFFGLCAALVALTSPGWRRHGPPVQHPAARGLQRLALAVTLMIYVQIVLCCQLRHLPPDGEPGRFVLWVWLVLILAGLTATGLAWLLIHVLRRLRAEAMIVRRGLLLVALFLMQLVLGAGAWVTGYGWPKWFTRGIWATSYTIVADGWMQVGMKTGHAALGPLILAASLGLTLWSFRLFRAPDR